jgi:hypothetical protein
MLLSLRVSLRAKILFLVASVLSLIQNFSREKPSSILKLYIVLRLCLALASTPGWLVLFLLECNEGELRLHQLVGGFGLLRVPTLVLLMTGAEWKLRG